MKPQSPPSLKNLSKQMFLKVHTVDPSADPLRRGPEDEDGHATVLGKDMRDALKAKKRGLYSLVVNAEAFGPTGKGYHFQYMIPWQVSPHEQIAVLSDVLEEIFQCANAIVRGKVPPKVKEFNLRKQKEKSDGRREQDGTGTGAGRVQHDHKPRKRIKGLPKIFGRTAHVQDAGPDRPDAADDRSGKPESDADRTGSEDGQEKGSGKEAC